MRRLPVLSAAAALLLAATAARADMSAETGALVHDLTAPFAESEPAAGAADPALFARARDILRREKLLGQGRPVLLPTGQAQALAKAMAVGPRYPQLLAEVLAVRNALLANDKAATDTAVQALYEKLGRKKPEGEALAKLIGLAGAALSPEPLPTERVVIERPDYTITIENQRQAGRARLEVLDKTAPGGSPALTEFAAEAVGRPDKTGKDFEVAGAPAVAAQTMTESDSAALASDLNGVWHDQNGKPWDVAIADGAATLIDLESKNRLQYSGTYVLGRIKASHAITHPDDIGEDLPAWVRAQLASRGISFEIGLTARKDGSRLDGVWISNHVTYNPGFQTVGDVHTPYDTRLTLTRDRPRLEVRFTDGEFQPLAEVPIYVIPGAGIGTGEVWVEVVAPPGDPAFDDGVIDQVQVTVTSPSDPEGETIVCIETSASSRLFRSPRPVLLVPAFAAVTP